MIEEIINKKAKYLIGLISGTSMDGVDAVLIKLKGCGEKTSFKQIKFITHPYPTGLKERINNIITNKKTSPEEISKLNILLGEIFADAALMVCKRAKIPAAKIDLIGSHGQTLWHSPQKKQMYGYQVGSTLQLGDPAAIAVKTGIPTIGDFRTADIASGGEGAPLIPYFDYLVFRNKSENRAVLNIGGISNITILPKNCSKADITGFDCGPGNILIDQAAGLLFGVEFDKNGKLAARGKISDELLNFLKKHPFIKKPPPKSTGREEFGNKYVKKILNFSEKINNEDIIRTLTEFTALAVYVNYQQFIEKKIQIDRLIVSGGGAKNNQIIKTLKKYFRGVITESSVRYGISPDAKESIAFAVYANETISGNTINIRRTTGAKKESILGKICFP